MEDLEEKKQRAEKSLWPDWLTGSMLTVFAEEMGCIGTGFAVSYFLVGIMTLMHFDLRTLIAMWLEKARFGLPSVCELFVFCCCGSTP